MEAVLRIFGNRAQAEDVELEELAEEYGLEIEEVELQNAFVYDYIIVSRDGQKWKINYDSDGYVTSVTKI